ncbi:recombination-associated protein RdgC [Coralloluteibacterium stylophorae]|uniref:Recombination-associated protein RdgC n=1 Tax=Coralloluteibacterium stylophorae TaxID=1776034 RepID=A0AAP2FYM8_9GAMM|nr:recombination-associated protein RdgC [Coralloluteibacterium stylophorae]MBS7457112.1 recombination-associated protein RdgC [Coralloluteibacterium stylophorae]
MFFKNLCFFRFPTTLTFDDLEERLAEHRLKPVGATELSSRGFVSPMGRDAEALTHKVERCVWLTMGGEERLLPSVVVNDAVQKKIDEIEETQGRRLGGRARKKLKEEIVFDLLPRAFVRPLRTDAYLDLEHGFIAIDTSSRKQAESVASELREALGSFPALPLNAETAPRNVLTAWLAGEALPEGLSLGDECELKDAADKGAVVKCTRQELDADEVTKHLEVGKQCTRLALTLDDHVSFVLGEDLIVRKLKFLDGAVESLENSERDDQRAELDARFALMSGELKNLWTTLEASMKLSRAEA